MYRFGLAGTKTKVMRKSIIKTSVSIICFAVLLLLFNLCFFPETAMAVELDLKAESAILLDAHSGKVLFERDAQKRMYPASMTKLMTMIVAFEAIEQGKVKLTDVVTASEKAASYGGSQIFLAAGEQLTLKELLLGIALASGNDASVAVAEYIAGSHEDFVALMNKKAAELGLLNTHFVNCNGLHDPEHYTTAADFGKIGLAALRHPGILELCKVKHYRIREETSRPFQFDNKNKLLWFYPGTDGFKTGWTSDSKYCFTATAERDGLRFVSVVMGVPVKSGHFADTQVLLNWGYSQYVFKEFYNAKQRIAEVEVAKGIADSVGAVAESKVGITVAKGQDKDITTSFELPPLVSAPVNEGQTLGYVSILQNGEVVGRSNLLAGEAVGKGSWWREFKKVVTAAVAG